MEQPHDDGSVSLAQLPEEVLMHMLCGSMGRQKWHQLLCRLEQVCHRFREPATLTFDDQEVLCLPERAAKQRLSQAFQMPVRPDGLAPVRPYERGPDESYRRVLQMLECGLMTRGVLHNVPVSAVEACGWQLAYAEPYSHRTRDAHLDKVPPEARYVLAAAVRVERDVHEALLSRMRNLEPADGTAPSMAPRWWATALSGLWQRREASAADNARFALLAWGRRDTVLRVTHDPATFHGLGTTTTNVDEDVYWYRWPGHSFGFSSDPALWLWAADAGIKQTGSEDASEDRLSWNLDLRSTGGWRAGTVIDLGNSSEWEKRLYYRM